MFILDLRVKISLPVYFFFLLACNENLLNASGYFFSPSFRAYYSDDMFCTWRITVPSRYTIHLDFQEFQLKNHPTCENCFLQIFDGRDDTAPSIGKFCGYGYPPFLVSSSNHFTIVLRCHGNSPKARFKAFYHAVGGMCFLFSVSFIRLESEGKSTTRTHL